MKKLLSILLISLHLFAQNNPIVYSALGDNIYDNAQAIEELQNLKEFQVYKDQIINYLDDVISAKAMGYAIEEGDKSMSQGEYLKILRVLSKTNDFFVKSVNTNFKYALKNIDISVKQGENIALVGDSGGGKSTFINMLLRFYDPDHGSLHVNGTDIKFFTQESLKYHISLVSQRIYIFQDTLASNVAYGQEIDEEEVHKALSLADASEFVNSLENGIHTKMEEFGANLSGGQRQRVAIARAIYKHSSLLLFDEATSALDNESEKRIQSALDEYTKDKITITIAHRLSTIEHADKILVVQKGAIVASGTHSQLLESSEVYQRLAGTFEK